MHNIEPAHHALQQEGGFAKGKELKQPITRVIRKISFAQRIKLVIMGTVACNHQHNQIKQHSGGQLELVSHEQNRGKAD